MTVSASTAVVTGGAKGIGRDIVLALLRENVDVAVADLDEKNMRKTREKGGDLPGDIKLFKMNVADLQQVKRTFREIEDEFGSIEILVNNAGVCYATSFEKISEDEWDEVLNINLKGAYFCTKTVLPYMKKQERGKIVNLSSLAGKTGGILVGAHYSASKAGIISLTKSTAKYAADFGINVNAVSPGLIDTEMTSNLDYNLDQVPLDCMGAPSDVAEAVKYLVSDEADYITGEILDVDGGILMD